nr:MAG TPA: hypothetical protein [Caudoviricetes sp.]
MQFQLRIRVEKSKDLHRSLLAWLALRSEHF